MRHLTFPLVLSLGFALACGGGTTTPPPAPPAPTPVAPTPVAPPPVAPTPVAPPVPVAKTFDQAVMVCCSAERADRLVDQYLDVSATLVKGESKNGQFTALAGVAQGAIDNGSFKPDEVAALRRIADNSKAALATDVEGKRKLFKSISADTILIAKAYAGSGGSKVAVASCPMYEGGSAWLQTETVVTNPYYGSSMLNCGSFQ